MNAEAQNIFEVYKDYLISTIVDVFNIKATADKSIKTI